MLARSTQVLSLTIRSNAEVKSLELTDAKPLVSSASVRRLSCDN